MPLPSDTSPEIEEAQLQLLREKSPAERMMMAVRLSDEVIAASKRAIARLHPELTSRERAHLFIEVHYGKELADAVREHESERERENRPMTESGDMIQALRPVVAELNRLGV